MCSRARARTDNVVYKVCRLNVVGETMTVTQLKNMLVVAALVCVVFAVHDIGIHLAYGSKASGWRPTRRPQLPIVQAGTKL